eukprot:EG_transcript_827
MTCRVYFTTILTVITLALSLAPAVTIWAVFMDLMTTSVDLLKGTTEDSTNGMVRDIQGLLMAQAIAKFDALLTEGEKEMTALVSMVQTTGVLAYDLWPSRYDLYNRFLTTFHSQTFNAMQGHPLFSQVSIFAGYFRNPNDTFTTHIAWVTWVAFLIDVKHNVTGNRTLYISRLAMAPDAQRTTMNITQVDQVNATLLYPLLVQTLPSTKYVLENAPDGWLNTMRFNQYTGQVELCIRRWLPAQNGTWVQPYLSVGASTISDELRSQLDGAPNDRLVLFFREPHGYMIAASHGKYFSHSDVDRRYLNPLVHPTNISAYRLWTCLQSDDALILQACQQLYDTYRSWTAIPILHEETLLSSRRYWVATAFSSGELLCTAMMLKDRASVMQNVDATNTEVDQSVSRKKGVTFVILGVVSAIAVVLPLAVGLWLATRLYTLATGMDRIAQLQFKDTKMPPTMFRELHRFQSSFTQMERGLQAFGKFVPQAVVKVLIAGRMKATDEMHPETVTIMFADIEGFSTVCETQTPTTLVTVCTEYFEAMCSNVVQRNGTIDKFIGDCIMAIWNAPDHLPGHEKAAVAASLAMQDSVLELHQHWQQRNLPLLKFRLGLHTGVCLVGNFGCSYRVSYTCLGDGVNLSSRLEALNKKFGTYLCVSHATYERCRDDFHFRRLAKVTVPGKAEVLPVYEVLCVAEAAELCTPKGIRPPGVINMSLEDLSEETLVSPARGRLRRYLASPQPSPSTENLLPTSHLPSADHVAYHWTYVDRITLLRSARQYELAYEALVAGKAQHARQLLASRPVVGLPDKAWDALAGQLEHCEASEPWDGVFHFREK